MLRKIATIIGTKHSVENDVHLSQPSRDPLQSGKARSVALRIPLYPFPAIPKDPLASKWLPEWDTKLCIKTKTIQLLVRMYKYRKKYARIVFGEPLPEELPLPKPVPKNIIIEALKVKASH